VLHDVDLSLLDMKAERAPVLFVSQDRTALCDRVGRFVMQHLAALQPVADGTCASRHRAAHGGPSGGRPVRVKSRIWPIGHPDESSMKVTRATSTEPKGLSVSIVVYRPDTALLERTVATLGAACDAWRRAQPDEPVDVCLVDNGGLGDARALIDSLAAHGVACRVIAGQGNVGYGRGHNLAIVGASSCFHLILNPDVDMHAQSLVAARAFFDAHPEVGLLAPCVADDAGGVQYLCRRYPTLLDLFVRGFLPAGLRARFDARLAHYEMRDQINERDVVWNPPIVSGCFMLFRTDVLGKLGGFDARYFLYFEDYDLSLRTGRISQIAYVPAVRVVHHGGGASRKGFAHVRMFAASAFRFFNRFGWRLW